MSKLLEISRNPEKFARFMKQMSVGTVVGFVAVVAFTVLQGMLRG
jgi:hypothetical protein